MNTDFCPLRANSTVLYVLKTYSLYSQLSSNLRKFSEGQFTICPIQSFYYYPLIFKKYQRQGIFFYGQPTVMVGPQKTRSHIVKPRIFKSDNSMQSPLADCLKPCKIPAPEPPPPCQAQYAHCTIAGLNGTVI